MIPAAAFEFLRGLAANNEKAWFEANRATYESAVREPVVALISSVALPLGKRGVPLEGDAKRSPFRIHRDVRFSKDKRPYKDHVGVVWFRQGGGRVPGSGILYFHLAVEQSFVAAAFHQPEPDVLDSIRERIRVHPDRFQAVEAALAAKFLVIEQGEQVSRMPRGFEDLDGSIFAPVLRLKSLVVRRRLTTKQVQGKALAALIARFGADARPLLEFGWAAVDEAG